MYKEWTLTEKKSKVLEMCVHTKERAVYSVGKRDDKQ